MKKRISENKQKMEIKRKEKYFCKRNFIAGEKSTGRSKRE